MVLLYILKLYYTVVTCAVFSFYLQKLQNNFSEVEKN